MPDRLASSFDDLSIAGTDTNADLDTCLALLASSDQPNAQDVVDELISLSAIYQSEDGSPTLTAYHPPSPHSPAYSPGSTLLVLLRTTLPSPHHHTPLSLILSLPPTYPASSAPLLQLENRFLGAEAVPAPLWAAVLRTFLHDPAVAPGPPVGEAGVEWVPGGCCLYEGVEKVREACGRWVGEREGEREAGERRRGEVARGSVVGSITNERREEEERRAEEVVREKAREVEMVSVDCPPITTTKALVDRKSVFVGHAARVTSIDQVRHSIARILRRSGRAKHCGKTILTRQPMCRFRSMPSRLLCFPIPRSAGPRECTHSLCFISSERRSAALNARAAKHELLSQPSLHARLPLHHTRWHLACRQVSRHRSLSSIPARKALG